MVRLFCVINKDNCVGIPLHSLVIRAAAALRRYPVDDLVGVHNVTGLAVDAVREIYLQAALAVLASINHLIDCGRAETLAGIAILFGAARRADVGIKHMQVSGLVFVMPDRRVIDIRQLIESYLPSKRRPL